MFRTDIWRVGIARAPIAEVLARGLDSMPIAWLDEKPFFQFDADPFGLWRDGILHLFVESYDYHTHHGVIDVIRLDRELNLLGRSSALREPWHLSYPFLVEDGGETYMLPEAHRSGALTLYRAVCFPERWEPVARIDVGAGIVPVDATPVRHGGLWWLFYATADSDEAKMGSLHAAWAERLTGPWTPHPANPLRLGRDGSRPGGTPVAIDGALVLPVQDCTATYGGALQALRIALLTPDRFEATLTARLTAPSAAGAYREGLHTLAAAGDVTLFDVKRIDPSWRRGPITVKRKLRKLVA